MNVLERGLAPGVLARRNHHCAAATIEHGKRRRRVVLVEIVEDAEASALLRLNLERVDVPRLGLQHLVEAPERVVRDVRRNAADPLDVLRLRLEERAELGPAIAAARQEADFGIEVLADLRITAGDLPQVVGVVVKGAAGVVAALRPGGAIRGRVGAGDERRDALALTQLDVRVEPVGTVPVLVQRALSEALAVDEDRAVTRTPDLALHPHDAEIVRRPDQVAAEVFDVVGLDVEQPHVPAAQLAAQAAAAANVDRQRRRRQADAPREEQIDLLRVAELESRGVLQEERAFLGEEQIEARQVDLLFVGLDLREVGVIGRIQGQVRTDAPLQIDTEVAVPIHRIVGRGAGEILVHRAERVGNQLDVAPGRHVEARHLCRQRDAVNVEAARNRRQVDLLILVADVPHDVEAPRPIEAGLVAQGLQRNRQLRFPAALGDLRAHGPIAIPVRIEGADAAALRAATAAAAHRHPARLPLARHLAVVLDAEGIGAEHEGVLVVVEGVEHHDNRIRLGQRGVAPRLRDDDLRRVAVKGDDADVDVALADDDADLGPFRGRRPFDRILLREGRIGLDALPDRIIHVPVNRRAFGRGIELGGGKRGNLGGLREKRGRGQSREHQTKETPGPTWTGEIIAMHWLRMIENRR